jgi:hypothetical protein
MDDNKFQKLIKTKCNLCFRKDSREDACMLFSSKHAGINICLGPFKEQEDRMNKVKEDFEKERKQKVDIDKAVREARINTKLNTYRKNKRLFDDWDSKRKSND